ncbi:MAG: universal stress protein [Candidatus Dormibacteraeota bacterium]|nr:universal stress protein [Candidatus Dormibacteraeota bacterium]
MNAPIISGKARPLIGEPGIRITIIPGALAGEMAELARAAGWDVKPSRAATADLEAALKAGAAGRLVLFVPPGSRLPTCLTHVLVPHDATPATSAVLARVGGAPLWSHAEMVMVHVATAELPSQPGSFPAPRMIDHDGSDWSDWREEFGRRFGRLSPGMLVSVEVVTGAREESILTVARQLRPDLLILAWSGVLEANRARTVRTVCALAPCPVLLVAGRGRGTIGSLLDAAGVG